LRRLIRARRQNLRCHRQRVAPSAPVQARSLHRMTRSSHMILPEVVCKETEVPWVPALQSQIAGRSLASSPRFPKRWSPHAALRPPPLPRTSLCPPHPPRRPTMRTLAWCATGTREIGEKVETSRIAGCVPGRPREGGRGGQCLRCVARHAESWLRGRARYASNAACEGSWDLRPSERPCCSCNRPARATQIEIRDRWNIAGPDPK